MFRKASLRKTFTYSGLVIIGLVLIAVSFQYTAVTRTHQGFDALISNDVERIQSLYSLRQSVTALYAAGSTGTSSSGLAEQKTANDLDLQQMRTFSEEHHGEDQQNLISNLVSQHEDFYKAVQDMVESTDVTAEQKLALEEQFVQLNNLISDALLREQINLTDDRAQLAAESDELARQSILAAVLPVLVTIILVMLVAMVLMRRLTNIKLGTDRIANGDFSRPIAIESQDEIGQVESAFNQMSIRLRDSYQRIAVEKRRDEALLQSMSEGMIAVDDKEDIVLMNDNAVELLDLHDKAHLVGQNVVKLIPLNDEHDKPVKTEDRTIHKALATGSNTEAIYTIHHKSGKKILINASASPVRVDDKTYGAIVVIRDVTKEREIDRMKTEFISLASHQLRTPLSAIKWFSEMLLAGDAGKLKPEQKDFATNIYQSTERMIELVNSLLNISRIESGRIIIDPKPTDLSELVSGIITDLKAKTEERNQTLYVSAHKGLPKINIDPKLIGQVYLNLLTNAIKYSPKGGEISVFISKKDDQIISQVTDNGYGIPKSEHKKMFQKFFRAENVIKIETDGTGLGMYLVKAIVESSGGKIWFESEEGKGTTFWFTLPMSGMQAKEGEVTLD